MFNPLSKLLFQKYFALVILHSVILVIPSDMTSESPVKIKARQYIFQEIVRYSDQSSTGLLHI